jgi:phosphate transport system substrate-binding protein
MARFTQLGMTALVALVSCGAAQAEDITGAGSTFVFPILSRWSGEYSAKAGTKIDYQPIGSGRGIVKIRGRRSISVPPMRP